MLANTADRLRQLFQDVSKSQNFAAADTTAAAFIAGTAKYTIYVQKILCTITTDAAQSITFKDSAGTPLVIAEIPASPGKGPQTFDFGPDGVALTEGKDLSVALSAAGLAFNLQVIAYKKPTAVRAVTDI